MFLPIQPHRNLTGEVVERLLAELSSGRLKPGQKLPSALEMGTAMRVSRTVIREAVAALKAQGLVTTRQGAGAFIADEPPKRGFNLDAALLNSLNSALKALEFRLAIETESAGLAAERASPSAKRAIREAHAKFKAAVEMGRTSADEDIRFHIEIARATENPHFEEFQKYLSAIVIPRSSDKLWTKTVPRPTNYLLPIKEEHQAIVDAIMAKDPDAARSAMRRHLTCAAERYRKFAAE